MMASLDQYGEHLAGSFSIATASGQPGVYSAKSSGPGILLTPLGAMLLLAVVGILAGLFWRERKRLARARKENQAPASPTDPGQVQRLTREILEARSRDQRRISQALHDGVGQNLAGIAMMLTGIETRMREEALPLADEIAKINGLIEKTSERSVEITMTRGLSAVDLRNGSLTAALRDLAAKNQALFGVPCRFTAADIPELDESVALHLYRIAQEALTNAIRHGTPGKIDLGLITVGKQLLLTIADDGTGIMEKTKDPRGRGLRIMNLRAEKVGGTFDVRCPPEGGTLVEVRCPLLANGSDST